MKTAPLPVDEKLRIEDLESYGILDSENEKEYDDLVELASQICECPIALITFVDNKRQWFKAKKQLEAPETSRDVAFCAHTILQDEVMVINDAKSDERFFDNPLVTGEVNIGFYAGAPIVSSSGHNLGSVCVIDNIKKEDLTNVQKNALKIIAGQVSKLLDLRVKNVLLQKKSDALLSAEKKISQLTIQRSDNSDKLIAFELHENLAQSLAAINIYLESAEKSKDLQNYFLKKSKELASLLVDDVRNLSKSIIPTTYENADYYLIIKEYGIEFGKQHNIKVQFGKAINLNSKNSTIGLNLFKIVQNLFEISKISEAKEIKLNVKSDVGINLDFRYDSHKNDSDSNQIITQLLNTIITRVELHNGVLSEKVDSNNRTISIKLPVEKV